MTKDLAVARPTSAGSDEVDSSGSVIVVPGSQQTAARGWTRRSIDLRVKPRCRQRKMIVLGRNKF